MKSWSKVLHNHDLFSSRAEVHARGSGRHIPEALVEQGKLLAEAGQSAGEIMKVFDSLAKKKHLPVTWTYNAWIIYTTLDLPICYEYRR